MAAAPAEMMGKQDRAEVLLRAAIDGNLRLLKKMAWGMDAGQGEAAVVAATADTAGRTALHLAAMEGRMDVLKYVVEDLHLDVNARCSRGHCEIVELLLSRGTTVDLHAVCGTPLHSAAFLGQNGTMKILLDCHADPNKVSDADDTPLVNAIRVKSLECVKLLIKVGADVNFIDSNGYTYVRAAADYGTPGIMKCIIAAGGQLYSNALDLHPSDSEHATLLANRSICWLRLENGKRVLIDATSCRMMRPYWPKTCYRQGAAFMLLKDYEKACDALKLDPTNVEIQNALRECREVTKNAGTEK